MKKIAILLCLLFCAVTFAFGEGIFLEPTQNPDVRYRLFATTNIWTFLKLDTVTGRIWQVQYSTTGPSYRFETVLNSVDLTKKREQEWIVGRFTLYPTQNYYNFILLDQVDGYTYQVQWNQDADQRMVIPISY
ncbi:MAG: hypothetical protein J6T62_00895 [Fibrobacter sp.]|nr:hypothetical protein [Fibrobacter sp.]